MANETNIEDRILAALEELKRINLLGVKEVLTVADVAALTGLSVSRIHHLAHAREIPYYKPNGKLFFKKSEVNAWMLRNRQDSVSDFISAAETRSVIEGMNGRKRTSKRADRAGATSPAQ